MPVIGEAYLDVRPTPGSEAAFTQSVRATAIRAVGIAAGVFAVRKLFQIGKESLAAFHEAEVITAQLDSRVEHLGDTAGVTSESVQAIAEQLMNMAGIEDETTKNAATLLLTFRDVRNEVGAGNDIFDRALKDLTDMSIVMGRDASSGAIQMGRALNDPITGLTALRRAGVSFDSQQKAMITTLTESGNLLGAQKIILRELEAEFGGAAAALGETSAGKTAILTANVGELKEAFGALIAEGLNPVIPLLTEYARLATEAMGAEGEMAASADASIGQLDSLAQQLVDNKISMTEFDEKVRALTGSLSEQTLEHEDRARVIQRAGELEEALQFGVAGVKAILDSETESTDDNVLAKKELIEANNTAAQSTRDLLSAELAGAGGLIGTIQATKDARSARRELAAAQAHLAKLEAEGKKGTDAWKEARKEANDLTWESVEAQAGLEQSFVDYGQSLLDAGLTQADAIAKVKELGRQGGVTKEQLQPLIDKVKDYAVELGVVPKTIRTDVKVEGITDSIAAIDRLIQLQRYGARPRPWGGGRDGGGGGGGDRSPHDRVPQGPPPIESRTTVIIEGRELTDGQDRHRRKVGGRTT